MSLRRTTSLASLLVLASSLCYASGDGVRRQHDAHVHGTAQLNLAIDGKNVFLELASPAMNIVGFEYIPSSEEDRHSVHEAAEKLEDGGSLFEFSKAAGCTLVTAEIESPLLGHEHHEEHDDKDSYGKEHDHGEKHDKEDDHHDAHGKEYDEHAHDEEHDHSATDEHGGAEHSEFEARYQFICSSPMKLKTLTVNLFTAFSGFEKLETQILTSSGQTAPELTARNNRVDL